jgi:hypothetical protein
MKNYIILLATVLFIGSTLVQGQSWKCVKGGDQSKFTANPEKKVNSTFQFDYQIYSTIESNLNGEIKRIKTHYYVNSRDGSLFFPKGILGMNNYDDSGSNYRFDGAVKLANGQLAIFLFDIDKNKKRVYTVDSNNTASNNFMNQHEVFLTFFNDREDPEMEQENPEPLPPSVDWSGILHGYTGYIYNNTDRAKMTIYLDEHPRLADKTSVPLTGFLAGILNYFDENKCNALVIFNKIEMSNGEYIQEELISINHEQKTFNGASYKPFGITNELTQGSGTPMQNMQAKMAAFQQKQTELAQKIKLWQEKRDQCDEDDQICKNHYKSLIDNAQKEGKRLGCELAKSMGAGDMMEGCNEN